MVVCCPMRSDPCDCVDIGTDLIVMLSITAFALCVGVVQIPPGGFSSFENLYQWRRDVQPTLTLADKCRPVEVFQEAGQVHAQ